MLDIDTMRADAIDACKAASAWVYRCNYAGGPQTISVREPNDHTLSLTSLHSWNYAKHAGCTPRTALAHLRKLTRAGAVIEKARGSNWIRFTVPREDAIAIGKEIIAELRAEGLPFDDEWRASRREDA